MLATQIFGTSSIGEGERRKREGKASRTRRRSGRRPSARCWTSERSRQQAAGGGGHPLRPFESKRALSERVVRRPFELASCFFWGHRLLSRPFLPQEQGLLQQGKSFGRFGPAAARACFLRRVSRPLPDRLRLSGDRNIKRERARACAPGGFLNWPGCAVANLGPAVLVISRAKTFPSRLRQRTDPRSPHSPHTPGTAT